MAINIESERFLRESFVCKLPAGKTAESLFGQRFIGDFVKLVALRNIQRENPTSDAADPHIKTNELADTFSLKWKKTHMQFTRAETVDGLVEFGVNTMVRMERNLPESFRSDAQASMVELLIACVVRTPAENGITYRRRQDSVEMDNKFCTAWERRTTLK